MVDEGRFEVHPLDRGRIDLNAALGGGVFAFVNGHHIHAHRILARRGFDLTGGHGGLVVLDLAFAGRRGGARRSRHRVSPHRLELHAANRAVARLLTDDLRVHTAGIELLRRQQAAGHDQHKTEG